ncbi:thiamine biosynthesis protein ThiS [Amylibacter kogurei]|uniref:Thiamine biosynthesis protein ThiS n=1 Tax=Paramylibacter kogurei TaxID=1889778 RepID=A0A2G5KAG8_9RHOB|nr:sulfur carrier protein ThiS [Amylibacter kogurei]PIB25860.1 thiamine biosynthesis protein ThiS [Amylibacter kogurei]
MKINVNGELREITSPNLADALDELGYGDAKIATAVNENFIPATLRHDTELVQNDRLEILAPMQGG